MAYKLAHYRFCFSIITLALLATACNFFSPREAESPAGNALWNSFPTTPALLLENLEYAYSDKQNAQKYSSLFADDYLFYYDEQDIHDLHLITPTIDINVETSMLLYFYNQLPNIPDVYLELALTDTPDNILADTAVIYRDYVLHVNNHGIEGVPNSFHGKMSLVLVQDKSNFWKIMEWHDINNGSDPSWGRMKHEFSS